MIEETRLQTLLRLVTPYANQIVARTWPHEDFHRFCDQLITFNCEAILRESNSQDLNELADFVLQRLERVIPQFSEIFQA